MKRIEARGIEMLRRPMHFSRRIVVWVIPFLFGPLLPVPFSLAAYEPISADLSNIPVDQRAMLTGIANVYRGDHPNPCTAFHIGNGIVVTAGHCIQPDPGSICEKQITFHWRELGTERKTDAISRCLKVLAAHYSPDGTDYAVLKTDFIPAYAFPIERNDPGKDEPVATPAEIWNRDYHRFAPPRPVMVFGHPQGMPLHRCTDCATRLLNGEYDPSLRYLLMTSGDLIGGFSGSPVIDAVTGKVLGIHITSDGGAMKLAFVPFDGINFDR